VPDPTPVRQLCVLLRDGRALTDDGGRLFVNDMNTPIIDGWAAGPREDQGSITLNAGQLYAIMQLSASGEKPVTLRPQRRLARFRK